MTDIPLPAPTALPPAPAPEPFLDPATGAIRVDALLAAYRELEARLAHMSANPAAGLDRPVLHRALGVPEAPEGYCIACDHGLFEPDPEINRRLHAAGFAPEQAQLLYDLAAERLVPMIRELAADVQAEREIERLVSHFGGEERWRDVSRQLLAWAGRNLPPTAVEGLSSSFEGVMALHRMMTGAEPSALRAGGAPAASAGDVHTLMRDPRYWRDRDPSVVARVTEAFQRLYPDH